METGTKLRGIFAALLTAAPNRESGSRRKSKTTVATPFSTAVQEDLCDANDDKDHLVAFACKFLSGFSNLVKTVTHK